MSVLIGACFGLGVSLFFKKFESYNEYPLRETAFILLSAYIAYSVSELLHLSGILSLFVCGVVMGHYAYHNLSEASQKGTVLAFESVAYLSEAFVYAYLGVSVTGVTLSEVPFAFAFMMLLILLFARFFSVFSLPCCSYLCRRSNFPLKIKELKIVWYSGLIRGIFYIFLFKICKYKVEKKYNFIFK
jgi:NhaP-type Na+/H+ or K+/H+ antiporter